jgi:hypothetical protein
MSISKRKNILAWLGYTLVPCSTPCIPHTMVGPIWQHSAPRDSGKHCQTLLLLPTLRMKCSGHFAPWVGSRKGPLPMLRSAPVILVHYPPLASPRPPTAFLSLLSLPPSSPTDSASPAALLCRFTAGSHDS